MDKKKMLKIILISVVVILVSVFTEIGIKKLITVSKERKEPHILPSVSKEQKEQEELFIATANSVAKLLEERQYEKIYARFPQIYKDAKYPTLTDFEEEMNSLIKEDSTIDVLEWTKTSRGYYATILIDEEKKLFVTIKGMDEENGTILLDNLYMLFDTNLKVDADGIKIHMKYCAKYLDKIGYILEIENPTMQNRKITFQGSSLYATNKKNDKTYNLIEAEEIEISNNSTKRVEIQFPVPAGIYFPPDELYLKMKLDDKDVYDITLDVSFNDAYFSM